MLRLIAAFLALVVSGTIAHAAPERRDPVVILVSFDGFRPDYLDRGVTPNLSRLAKNGVKADMRPAFPSKTFPNHWTLVTGKVPDRNGIVANRMEDPARPGEVFTMASDDPFWWNAAEPIWVAAERANIRTATMFWPGSNVGWGGTRTKGYGPVAGAIRPADWQQFNQEVSPAQRVNAILDWLRRPAAIRPRFLTLYFDTVDTAGHEFGPDDSRTTAAVAQADRDFGVLLAGLEQLGQPANLVVVGDHGMAAVSSERVIVLEKIVDPSLYRLIESGPYAAFVPTEGNSERLAAALLAEHEHMQCWRKEAIPARLRYGTSPRVPPFLCLAKVGWTILPKAPAGAMTGGAHGYDSAAPEMATIFIGNGPAFTKGSTLQPFDNVSIVPLLRLLLGLPQVADGDGNAEPFRGVMRK